MSLRGSCVDFVKDLQDVDIQTAHSEIDGGEGRQNKPALRFQRLLLLATVLKSHAQWIEYAAPVRFPARLPCSNRAGGDFGKAFSRNHLTIRMSGMP